MRKDAEDKIQKYDIRPPNARLRTASFSGGNQQKIVVAVKSSATRRCFWIGQPTRGVDIAPSNSFIDASSRCVMPARRSCLVSVELDEIRALSDRILVMFAGPCRRRKGG